MTLQWNNKPSFFIIINVLLSVCIVALLMVSANQWYRDWQLTHTKTAPVPVVNVNENALLIEEVPNLHVFGKSMQTVSDVPVSNLELRITGIAKSTNPDLEASKAYISISNQPSKIVNVGDVVSFGVKLYDVTNDAIVIENNGRLEKLPLIRNKLEFKARPAKETN